MPKKKLVEYRANTAADYALFYDTGNFTYYVFVENGGEIHKQSQPDAGREEYVADTINTIETLKNVDVTSVIITHDMVDEEAVRFHVPNDIDVKSIV